MLIFQVLWRKSQAASTGSLLETDRKLKFALSEISSITNSKITQSVVQQSLKQTNFEITYDRKQELNSLLIDHPMITSFSFYSKDRLIYQYNGSISFKDLKQQSWFSAMERTEGRPVWSGPGENGSELSDNPVLVHARVIKDYHSLEDIGYLVVKVRPDLLDQIFWEAATLKKEIFC